MPSCHCRLPVLLVLLLLGACQQSPVNNKPAADPQKLAQVNTELAFQYMQEGEYEIAIRKLDKAFEAVPGYVDAHNAMGLVSSRLGRFDDAEDSFRRALRFDPDNSSALNNYGQFLCQRGRYEEGQQQFLKAVDNPLYKIPAVAYSNAGSCALDAGDLAAAENHFRAALELDPRLGPALIQMADISHRLERYLPARAYLQRYLEGAPHTARTLWLGILIERELGDRDALASYALQLEKNFPDSTETGMLMQSGGP